MAKTKAILSVLLTALILCGGLASVGSVRAPVVDTVNVGSLPRGVIYDSGKGEIFVANSHDFTVSVISDSNNDVIATIPVSHGAEYIAYDSGRGEIFVAQGGGISVISDISNSVVTTVLAGPATDLAYDSGKNEIFAVCGPTKSVSVISDISKTIVANISLPVSRFGEIYGIAYDSGKGEVFVGCSDNEIHGFSSTTKSFISVISDANNSVVATIPMENIPPILAYCPGVGGNGLIYVSLPDSGSISIISDATNTVIGTLSLGGFGPGRIVYDSALQTMFVGVSGNRSSIWAITNGTTVLATFPLNSTPKEMAYDSGKGELFISDGIGTVTVISDSFGAPASPSPTASMSPSPTATQTSTPTPSSTTPTPAPSPSIPEFPTWITLPATLMIIVSVVFVTFGKRKKKHH